MDGSRRPLERMVVPAVTAPFFELVVPGNPLPKARPRFKGHAYTSKATKDAEKAILDAAIELRGETDLFCIEQPIRVELHFFRGNRRPCDLDNLAKLTLDALNGEVWADDSLIVDLRVTKAVDRACPRTVVRVWLEPIEDAA